MPVFLFACRHACLLPWCTSGADSHMTCLQGSGSEGGGLHVRVPVVSLSFSLRAGTRACCHGVPRVADTHMTCLQASEAGGGELHGSTAEEGVLQGGEAGEGEVLWI